MSIFVAIPSYPCNLADGFIKLSLQKCAWVRRYRDTIYMPSHLIVLFLFSSTNSSVHIFLCLSKYSWSYSLQRAIKRAVS